MWDNPRVLNLAAGALVGIAALVFSLAGITVLLRSEFFPVREVQLTRAPQKTSREQIVAAIDGRVGGNIFSASLDDLRASLERLPWVRHVAVRRVWPDQLEVALEEHVALARWGEANDDPQLHALVNTVGERFHARTDAVLPVFIAPSGTEAAVARRYARFAQVLAPLGTPPDRVVLTARFAWQLRLGNGLQLMLGRDPEMAESRLARFVEAYPLTLGKMARHHDYVDLRYPNGFALRVPEFKS